MGSVNHLLTSTEEVEKSDIISAKADEIRKRINAFKKRKIAGELFSAYEFTDGEIVFLFQVLPHDTDSMILARQAEGKLIYSKMSVFAFDWQAKHPDGDEYFK